MGYLSSVSANMSKLPADRNEKRMIDGAGQHWRAAATLSEEYTQHGDSAMEELKANNAESTCLPIPARFFITSIGIVGVMGMLWAFSHVAAANSSRFPVYLFLAAAGSGMKVRFPGAKAHHVGEQRHDHAGLLELGLSETLILAIAALATQSIWHSKTPTFGKLVFNTTSIALAVLAANWAYQRPWFGTFEGVEFVRLAFAAVPFFIVNISLLAMIIALAERKNFHEVWSSFSNWTFLYYLIAAALAEVVHVATKWLGWSFTLALLPLLYAIYRSCRIYFEKLDQEKAHAQNMAALHLRTIEALAMAIEAKDRHPRTSAAGAGVLAGNGEGPGLGRRRMRRSGRRRFCTISASSPCRTTSSRSPANSRREEFER